MCLLDGRGLNPVFALVESAWMISGNNDVAPLQTVLAGYRRYSDDGRTLNGAYGFRLRAHFGVDQIKAAVKELQLSPASRRVVLSMYSADDLGKQSEDIPCNTQVMLRVEDGRLTMTVINRSNDLWLGVPYNWFAFRVLQHFMANELAMPPGPQRHVSTCMHLYEQNIAIAKHVVTQNSISSIQEMEKTVVPLDIDMILSEVSALSIADLAAIQSPELAIFFQRYLDFRNSSPRSVRTSVKAKTSSVLDIALDQWIDAREQPKESLMPLNSFLTNADTPTHLALQHLVFPSDSQNCNLMESLRTAADNVRPLLPTLLTQDLPAGVHITMDTDTEIQASLHIVLELVLGSLDPELRKTTIGEHLIQRLGELARQLGLPERRLVGREMSEVGLRKIFGHIFH